MCEPVFKPAEEGDIPFLTKISAENPKLCELYTSLKITGAVPYIGSLWCGKINDEITEVIYSNGSYVLHYSEGVTAVYRDEGDIFNTAGVSVHPLCFMLYKGILPPEEDFAVCLEGKSIRDSYRLAKGVDRLPEKTEMRCLYSMLCANHGLGAGFGIYEGEALIAAASVVAVNKAYALIGNVFTAEEHRRRGLAAKTVSAAVRYALEKKLVPVLFCERELSGFYEKTGFEAVTEVNKE